MHILSLWVVLPGPWRQLLFGANTSTIARVWDAFHGAQQRQVLSEYLLNVNFAENHQSGDNYAATQENITNGTQRTVLTSRYV